MDERFGEYELVRHIATGGMAEIFIARHSTGGLDRVLVIKRMLPELAVRPDFVTMFLDEARLTASLQHPHVVRVHDLGQAEGSYFIAMELVDGPHLGALFAHSLRARRPLPVELCAWIVARAADGLHYAHEVNDPATGHALELVHRDISPQNILVSRNGAVKVTDFGVAKASTQKTKTRTGIVKGKVSYMSPEQCLGEEVDRRTDVFALGIVLYELLTRRRLFREKSDLLIMQRITAEDVAPASTVNPVINGELDAIVARALARNADARYATAGEFAEALDAWLRDNKRPADELSMQTWFAANCAELAPTTTLSLVSEANLAAPFLEPPRISSIAPTSATPSFSSRLAVKHTRALEDSGENPVIRPIADEPTTVSLPPRFEPAVQTSRPGEQNLLVEPPSTTPEQLALTQATADPVVAEPVPTPSGRFKPLSPTPSGRFQPLAPTPSGRFKPLVSPPTDGLEEALQGPPSGTFTPATATAAILRTPRGRPRHMAWAAGGGLVAIILVVLVGMSMRRAPAAEPAPLPPVAPPIVSATLVVTSVPDGAAVMVGNRVRGTTPVRIDHPAGTVTVQAQFADQPPQLLQIVVPAVGEVPVHFEARVPLRVTSTPSIAKVRVNGALVGETPFDRGHLVDPGAVLDIVVEPPAGFQPWHQQHTAAAGETLLVDAVLVPKERQPARPVIDEGRGSLSVRTEPWSLVRVDKEQISETPFVERPVKAGKRMIFIKNGDVGLDDKFAITIPKDKTLAVILKYEKVGGVWKLMTKTIR